MLYLDLVLQKLTYIGNTAINGRFSQDLQNPVFKSASHLSPTTTTYNNNIFISIG